MRITVISLDQWGYDSFIVRALEKKGIDATHIDFSKYSYSYPTFFHKVYNFFAKAFAKHNIKKAFLHKKINQELAKLPIQDQILMIKADHLLPQQINEIKKHGTKFIAYFSDSVAKCPKIKKIHHLFDEVYSYERKDVKKYGFKFITNYIYNDLPSKGEPLKYSVFNIGAFDRRIIIIEKIARQLEKIAPNYKIISVGKKATKYSSKGTNIIFTDKKMGLEEVYQNIQDAWALLDVNKTIHSGLTFRVFESIGHRKKLITTNEDIINYDFYNPRNIAVITPQKVKIPNDFFSAPYQELPPNIFEKYMVDHWVKTVFKI